MFKQILLCLFVASILEAARANRPMLKHANAMDEGRMKQGVAKRNMPAEAMSMGEISDLHVINKLAAFAANPGRYGVVLAVGDLGINTMLSRLPHDQETEFGPQAVSFMKTVKRYITNQRGKKHETALVQAMWEMYLADVAAEFIKKKRVQGQKPMVDEVVSALKQRNIKYQKGIFYPIMAGTRMTTSMFVGILGKVHKQSSDNKAMAVMARTIETWMKNAR